MSSSVIDKVNPLGKNESATVLNHIALLVDESGSMAHLASTCVKTVNEQVTSIKKASHESNQITKLSIYTFSSIAGQAAIRNHHREAHPEAVWFSAYYPGGDTPLNDAVRNVIYELEGVRTGVRQEAFLVIVLTDGEENRSIGGPLGNFIRERIAQGNWTFAFLVPPRAKEVTARMTGVSLENIREWEATESGLRTASVETVNATSAYYGARSRGALKTDAFFTDLSKVKASDINKLDDVGKQYRRWAVEREEQISKACKDKIGSYEIGKAFYELMKPEEIQAHKQIIIGERKTRKLHGGTEARRLLGLTVNPGVTIKVKPGNHADWRIFVQSTSMNRKLVRGTDILYFKA